ncbi:hypothetical protein [Fodinicola feengrottensis]|uniref:hypothetical protein n=1 Tax=Fodinicola feengrottensis TaxID=435914 RepID=UPI0013D1FF58
MSVLVTYAIYGAGYTAYMTFVIAFLTAASGGSVITLFWLVLGGCGVASSIVWTPRCCSGCPARSSPRSCSVARRPAPRCSSWCQARWRGSGPRCSSVARS